MNLILYPSDETEFKNNGIGVLSDAIDAEVYEELNGQFELTVQYPVDGIHYDQICCDSYITAKPNPVTDPQPFRIYRITTPMRGVVTVYARHMAYRNRKIVVAPFTAANAPDAMQKLKSQAVTECPFEFWTDKETQATMTVAVPSDIWTLLGNSKGSVLDTYGGEYEFDRFTVKLHNRRGADRGVSIRYGKNLTDLKQDENIANVYTGVYPYWTDGTGGLVTLPEKFVAGPGEYAEHKILALDMTEKFTEKPTEQQLRTATERYIADNDIGKPTVSMTVEFAQLEQTEEYKGQALLERVLLGDTVSVLFPKMKVDASARAVATQYKPLLERYKSVTLGRVRANLATTITQQKQEIEGLKKPGGLQAAVDRATGWITGGGGYMIAVRDENGNWSEICSLDEPDVATATKVWRWNNGGFGYSSTGYDGPFRLAITQGGEIVADFITAGTLDAALVKVINLVADSIVAGRLTSKDGSVYFDLDKGEVFTERVNVFGDLTGMRLSAGELNGTYRGLDESEPQDVFSISTSDAGSDVRAKKGDLRLDSVSGTAHVTGQKARIFGSKEVVISGDKITIEHNPGGSTHLGGNVYMEDRKLAWLHQDGYKYLVGVDVEENEVTG